MLHIITHIKNLRIMTVTTSQGAVEINSDAIDYDQKHNDFRSNEAIVDTFGRSNLNGPVRVIGRLLPSGRIFNVDLSLTDRLVVCMYRLK